MMADSLYPFIAFRFAAQYFFIRALTARRASADIFRRRLASLRIKRSSAPSAGTEGLTADP